MSINLGSENNHSTSQAVMEVIDSVYQYHDIHKVTMAIYLNLQKAFDTVDHSNLFFKMNIYIASAKPRIRGGLHRLMCPFTNYSVLCNADRELLRTYYTLTVYLLYCMNMKWLCTSQKRIRRI